MVDVLLWSVMLGVCGALGLPLARLLPTGFAWREFLAPTFGSAVLAVFVTNGYRLGLSMRVMFVASLAIAVVILALHIRRHGVPRRRSQLIIIGTWLAASIVLLAPRWTGGDQFTVFRGNQWDTFNYVESALTFAEKPYHKVRNATPAQLLREPVLVVGNTQLPYRPAAHELYALFTRVAPGQAYRLYYTYLVYFMAQLVLVGLFVVRNMLPRARPIVWIAIASAFPLGFWGQYILDIDAWSQVASAPLLLAIFGLVLHIGGPWKDRDGLRLAAGLAITTAGAVYVYPEGLMIYAAATGPVAIGLVIAALIRARRWSWRPWLPFIGFGGVTFAVLSPDLLALLVRQVGVGAGGNVTWWQFFQRFFLGRDNVWGSGFDRIADFISSLFGCYFVTPTDEGFVQRLVVLALIAGAIVAVLRIVRTPFVIPSIIVSLLLLVPAALLALKGSYWAAGKVVSYAAPVFILTLCLPLAHRSRWRWFTIAFVALQIGSGLVRIPVATFDDHIGYAAPYPGVQLPALKHDIGWDLTGLEPYLDSHSKVTVFPSEPWSQNAMITFLTVRGIPFYLQAAVASYPGGPDLGKMPVPWTPTVELSYRGTVVQLDYFDGRPSVRIPTR